MNPKQNKNTTLIGLGLALFTALALFFSQGRPPETPAFTETPAALVEAPGTRPPKTQTPAPTNIRPGTATSPVDTATPVTPPPTATLGLTLTIPASTETPVGTGHNPTVWHAPSLQPGFRMHHGVNPSDYIDVFGPILEDYLATYGQISYPWLTPDENLQLGYGHHTGYVWLYDQARGGCEFNKLEPPASTLCVTDVLMVVHSDGTKTHLRKRFHSHYVFLRACDQATGMQCRTYGTGGWVDYGILETPYKDTWCQLPGVDPLYFTQNPGAVDLNQPPYRTSHTELRGNLALLKNPLYFLWDLLTPDQLKAVPKAVEFWSGLRPNAINQAAYNLGNGKPYPQNVPNYTVGVAWSSLDSWGIIQKNGCANPELDTFYDASGGSALNNSAFQIYAVFLYQHPPAPESGFEIYFTNRWGHVLEGEAAEACTVAGVDCVPFYVSSGGIDGPAILNRNVGDTAEDAPILEFDLPGGGVIIPAPILPFGFPQIP